MGWWQACWRYRQLARGITSIHWLVGCVAVGIDPTLEPCRIALDVSSDAWVVVAERVLVQAVLDIEVLAREAQVGERGEGLLLGLAEGAQHRVPGEVLRRVGRLLRRIKMIQVDKIERATGHQRQRHAVEPEVLRLRRAVRTVALGEEMAGAVVEEMRNRRWRGLRRALTEEVVCIRGERLVLIRDLHHAVAEIIGEAERRAATAVVGRDVAGRRIAEAARGAPVDHAQELVAVGGVGVGLGEVRGSAALRGAVADGVVAIGERAIEGLA